MHKILNFILLMLSFSSVSVSSRKDTCHKDDLECFETYDILDINIENEKMIEPNSKKQKLDENTQNAKNTKINGHTTPPYNGDSDQDRTISNSAKQFSHSSPYKPQVYEGISTQTYRRKIIPDDLHGEIQLHPVQMALIDSKVFQRLRKQHQLGAATYIFPTATHKRFEHSIGVAHLAEKLITNLYNKLPNNVKDQYTPTDLLCVRIAALLHDLGHGPYSHLWDEYIADDKDDEVEWTHELGSTKLIDYILKTDERVASIFKEFGLDTEENLNFIKECITAKDSTISEVWTYKSRPESHAWLFEVVSNNRSGIDVDRLDYLLRDATKCGKLCGHKPTNGIERYLIDSRVNIHPETGRPIITIPEKDRQTMFEDVYSLRNKMHSKVYQSNPVKVIELMVKDILLNADDILQALTGDQTTKLSKSHLNMAHYSKLTEEILSIIEWSNSTETEKSREILDRLYNRKLYKFIAVGPSFPTEELQKHADKIQTKSSIILDQIFTQIQQEIKKVKPDSSRQLFSDESNELKKEDFGVTVTKIHFGDGIKNPLKNLHYFNDRDSEIRTSEECDPGLLLSGGGEIFLFRKIFQFFFQKKNFSTPSPPSRYFSSTKFGLIYKREQPLDLETTKIILSVFTSYMNNIKETIG